MPRVVVLSRRCLGLVGNLFEHVGQIGGTPGAALLRMMPVPSCATEETMGFLRPKCRELFLQVGQPDHDRPALYRCGAARCNRAAPAAPRLPP